MNLKAIFCSLIVELTILLSTWPIKDLCAQSANLAVGPTLGVSQYNVSLAQDAPPSFGIKALPGFSLGAYVTYTKKRILVNSQVLLSFFNYQVTNTLQLTSTQSIPYRVNTKVACYTLPITLGYRLVSKSRLNIYGGGGLHLEWKGAFRSTSIDDQSGRSIQLPPRSAFQPFTIGGHIKATARVPITPRWVLQASPTLLYYPSVDILFGQRNSFAFSAQLSINVLLN